MSEVQSRPSAPRGRGSARGGRGGFSSRGGRGGRGQANGDKSDTANSASIEDDSEVGQLKKKYGSKVSTIQEMFPDWTDEDVVFALQETDGDLETAVDRISDGTITQWGEVSKSKKDRSKSKAKDTTDAPFSDVTNQTRVSRGGRAGFDGARGGRGRGTDRGRGRGGRGAAAQTNGSRKEAEVSVPTTESPAWDATATTSDDNAWDSAKPSGDNAWDSAKPSGDNSWESGPSNDWGSKDAPPVTTAAVQAVSSIIPEGVKKTWASMFTPAPAPKKAPERVDEKPAEPTKLEEPAELPSIEPEAPISPPAPLEEAETTPLQEKAEPVVITPSKDELTESNLERVLDESAPAPTATAASTAASSWDPRSATNNSTPYSALQSQQQAIRPPTSGFQASALKATGTSGRTPSYQRRVLDQEEAVRMPGNREVDRTAVQFGAFNLNGSGEEDVDGEREDAETRAQPPQHSPVAPRAALPPAPQQSVAPASESLPTPKQAPGFPATSHPTAAPGLPSPAPLSSAQGSTQQGQQVGYGRYGGQENSSLPQKPYDAFSQQAPSTQSPFEGVAQSQGQQPQHGAFSSAPGDFSSYYTAADAQQRQAYNNYYQQQYNSQGGAQGGQPEGPSTQQRGFGGYNGPQTNEGSSPFPQSAAQQPSRYAAAGDGQNSGHTTPNPASQSQQQASQGAQQQQQSGHPQQPYPFGHPYYNSPYYQAYMNQYNSYGNNYPGPYGKGGAHQPYQGYAMSPGAPYEHASSPAAGAYGGGASSLHGRDSALGGGLGDYGRGQSAQSSQAPGIGGGSAFGASHDTFGRNSSYQGQNQYNSQQGNQQGSTDDLKPFGESKNASGPSPSLSQAGRPGSATNPAPGSALPPPQSQQAYGGYPAHLQQGGHGVHNQSGSQYGLGGAGHQNNQYPGYSGFSYGNNQQQRGWGTNYGH